MSKSSSTPISVFFVTLNEAEHIKEALQSVKSFDEIIVVDSGSTDGTQDIVKEYGAKLVHKTWLGFAKQKAYAMSLCKNNWVLNLDGDEIVPEDMVANIQRAVNSGHADAYRLSFEDVFWQQPMSAKSAKRSIVRLYKKTHAAFPLDRLVHENVQLIEGAKEAKINGKILHYGYDTTHKLVTKQNSYSSLKAEEKAMKGKRPSLLKLIFIFPIMFAKTYFLRRMILSGRRGLVHAVVESMYAFLKEAKLHELTYHKKRKPSSENN
ncbi:glycosyltransferase family 2 protein [Alteromonas sp. ASW11-130]|uniref:glycosyltransferase family 2 protein n=1 Tax=Alteromonas sp. ASW11-130 TaxID=3015775 RepID=UPI0022423BFD|nr:glycosyltransferase family 2 protein [Alteromonas sp. ASW11-130]MCW8093462.1 glycosyltransferase family 2 protein [Alteromonas sp. ASW11-130]